MKNRIRCAVDLGTTTVDCCLYDEESNKVIASQSFKNPQSLYGSDVINRINAVIRYPENKSKLKKLISDKLNTVIKDMIIQSQIQQNSVYKIVICGNTTMVSLIYGLDVTSLGSYPFEPLLTRSILCKANEVMLDSLKDDTEVILSGCASAFIGGDILSGLYFLKKTDSAIWNDQTNLLFLDLGTNGEMVLKCKNKYYATSTACGPAFENCTRRQNAYGSSTIDALAMCLRTKKIDDYGSLRDEYLKNGIDIMGLHIDMDIIHQIILAKSAIRTGIDGLLDYAGIGYKDVDKIYVAGGFGFYLNIENAILLGILPSEFMSKISISGNTSLHGALTASAEDIDYFTDKIEVLQLALDNNYQEKLINNMKFGV